LADFRSGEILFSAQLAAPHRWLPRGGPPLASYGFRTIHGPLVSANIVNIRAERPRPPPR
jgi:hypothetical protein